MIVLNLKFNCHLTLYFSQKRNFIDYSGDFMDEVAAILDFVRLGKSGRKFILAQRIYLFIMLFWSTVPKLVFLSAR